MARCGCTGGCSCSVQGSAGPGLATTTVTGNGAPGTPYIVQVAALVGDCCQDSFYLVDGVTIVTADGGEATPVLTPQAGLGYFYSTPGYDPDVEEFLPGLWQLHAQVRWTAGDLPQSGWVRLTVPADSGPFQAGLHLDEDATGGQLFIAGSGACYFEDPWQPQLYIRNATDQDIENLIVTLSGVRVCAPCDITFDPGGG